MQFGNFGIWQILIVVAVILLMFGPRAIPQVAKNVGQLLFQFRQEVRDFKRDIDIFADDDDDDDVFEHHRRRRRRRYDDVSHPPHSPEPAIRPDKPAVDAQVQAAGEAASGETPKS